MGQICPNECRWAGHAGLTEYVLKLEIYSKIFSKIHLKQNEKHKLPNDKIASVSILSSGRKRLLSEFRGGITTSIGMPMSGQRKLVSGGVGVFHTTTTLIFSLENSFSDFDALSISRTSSNGTHRLQSNAKI